MLFDRLLGAASEELTSALLNLVMDASVLMGTASLLCYKDFVQTQDDDAQHMYAFFRAATWGLGWLVAALLLVANWSLGRAVDRRSWMTRSRTMKPARESWV